MRPSLETSDKMPEQIVHTFNWECFRFWNDMLILRQELSIRFPVIRGVHDTIQMPYLFPKFLSCLCSSIPDRKINYGHCFSIHCQPDPEFWLFFRTKCHSSSHSITDIFFDCFGISRWRCMRKRSAARFIHFKTATLLTPRILPIPRNPIPSRYKRSAWRFISLGLPWPWGVE